MTALQHQSHLIKHRRAHTHALFRAVSNNQIIRHSLGENSPDDCSHYCGRENVNKRQETQLNTSWRKFIQGTYFVLTSQVERSLFCSPGWQQANCYSRPPELLTACDEQKLGLFKFLSKTYLLHSRCFSEVSDAISIQLTAEVEMSVRLKIQHVTICTSLQFIHL